jgi:aryl-alcohol dehydrogenase-like predicted oxidoreductase
MRKNRVSGTNIEVSAICLGTMTFGTPVAEKEAVALVHWALDHGINFIDTADIYEGYTRFLGSPGGVAESILGVALQGRRDHAVLTTKVGNPVGDGEYQGAGLGRNHIRHQICASLKRLGTDYVDFYELHKEDPNTPLEESLSVMAALIEEGKVRHWGFSNFGAGQIEEMLHLCDANDWPFPVIAQPLYNWLERACEQDYLPHCRDNGISVTPYQPLQGGLLTGKYRRDEAPPEGSRALERPQWVTMTEGVHERLDVFHEECSKAGMTPAEYAVHWLLKVPGITSVVAGVRSTDQLALLMSGAE